MCIEISKKNGAAEVDIFCESQEDFESALERLLAYLLEHGISQVIFKAGNTFLLPAWFIKKCKQYGIKIVILGDGFIWSQLSHLQVGKYSEYYVKMEFIKYGLDVFTPEIDDKGIDFIIKNNKGKFFEIQVKAVRGFNYVYMKKNKFNLSPNLYLALVMLKDGSVPELFLIPSTIWHNPNQVFVSRNYKNKKSPPEWGINLSKKNKVILDYYKFHNQILNII